jgi:hypothetical protein
MEENAVESGNYKQRVLPRTVRWLAIAAGFVAGIAFLSFTGCCLFWRYLSSLPAWFSHVYRGLEGS